MSDLVTVVMATKNSEQYIAEALRSILYQVNGPVRTVVVDKESTDGTLEIAGQFPFVEIVQQSTTGYHRAWSQGIELSLTPYVCLLDSDDVYSAEGIACGVKVLEGAPLVDASLGRVEFFGDSGASLSRARLALAAKRGHPPIPGCFMFRRSLFRKFGMFDSKLAIMGDVEWFLNAKRRGLRVTEHDSVVLRKRVHNSSLGIQAASTTPYSKEILEVVRQFHGHKSTLPDGVSAQGER